MSSVPTDLSAEVHRLQRELQAMQTRLQSVANASGSLLGKMELCVNQEGVLVLAGADAKADQLLGKACSPFFVVVSRW